MSWGSGEGGLLKTQRQCPHLRLSLTHRTAFLRGLARAVGSEERRRAPGAPLPQASSDLGEFSPLTLVAVILPLHQSPTVKRGEGTCFKHLLCAKHCVGHLRRYFIPTAAQPLEVGLIASTGRQETSNKAPSWQAAAGVGRSGAHLLQSHFLPS